MGKYSSSNYSGDLTRKKKSKTKDGLCSCSSWKESPNFTHGGGRSVKHQDGSGNFLKLIFFNTEINKIWRDRLCYNMAHLGCCELFIPDCTHSACLFTNLLKPSHKMVQTFLKLIYLDRLASRLASFFALLKKFCVCLWKKDHTSRKCPTQSNRAQFCPHLDRSLRKATYAFCGQTWKSSKIT